MKSTLQFLTTPTSDTPSTTLLLTFSNKKYIFGALGEGSQRAVIEQGVRINKVHDVFLTGITKWKSTGGLFGFILVMADMVSNMLSGGTTPLPPTGTIRGKIWKDVGEKEVDVRDYISRLEKYEKEYVDGFRLKKEKHTQKPVLTLFGPGGLAYMLATARKFIFRTSMPLSVNEIPRVLENKKNDEDTLVFQDENIRVWSMITLPSLNERVTTVRKRSHDDMMNDNPSGSDHEITQNGKEKNATDISQAVISQMFNSDWQMDRLHECSIHNVKLPAQIFVRDPNTHSIIQYTGPIPDGKNNVPDVRVLVRSPWPGAVLTSRLPPPLSALESVSYIVKTYPQRGKFDPKKAQALGLKDKSKYSLLTAGQSITTLDGTIIHPDQVLGPTRDGTGFAIFDIPTVEYIQPLLNQLTTLDDKLKGIKAIIWNLGSKVILDHSLKSSIEQMNSYQHYLTSPDVNPDRLSFDSAAAATIKLSAMDPEHFQPPFITTKPALQSSELPNNAQIVDRGHLLTLESDITYTTNEAPPLLNKQSILSEIDPEAISEAEKARSIISSSSTALLDWSSKLNSPDTQIVTLGTGSSLPSKYRNVSSNLIRVPGWGSILLDCGEDTLGQLKRVFPPDELKTILHDLKLIWISHLHADHHLGTAAVVKAWYTTVHSGIPQSCPNVESLSFNPVSHLAAANAKDEKRLTICSDADMIHWLWEYSQLEDIGYSHLNPIHAIPSNSKLSRDTLLYWFCPPKELSSSFTDDESEISRRLRFTIPAMSLDFQDLNAIRVRHCNNSLGLVLTLPPSTDNLSSSSLDSTSGLKLVYSGDCRPSAELTLAGKGADLLIHEATFDDELIGDAIAKRHSTTGEALQVAQGMCVPEKSLAVILTHFSQRYAKVPVLEYASSSQKGEEGQIMDLSVENDEDGNAEDTGNVDIMPSRLDSENEQGTGDKMAQKTFKIDSRSNMKVCVAFDYMKVKLRDVAMMEYYVPALLKLYGGDEERREQERKVRRDGIERTKVGKEKAREVIKDKQKTKAKP